MRTVIFLGLLSIANAIRPGWCEGLKNPFSETFLVCVLAVVMAMDIVSLWNSRT